MKSELTTLDKKMYKCPSCHSRARHKCDIVILENIRKATCVCGVTSHDPCDHKDMYEDMCHYRYLASGFYDLDFDPCA